MKLHRVRSAVAGCSRCCRLYKALYLWNAFSYCSYSSEVGIPFLYRQNKLLSFSIGHNLTICEAQIVPTPQGGRGSRLTCTALFRQSRLCAEGLVWAGAVVLAAIIVSWNDKSEGFQDQALWKAEIDFIGYSDRNWVRKRRLDIGILLKVVVRKFRVKGSLHWKGLW